jgi:hypothetical protein
VRLKDDKGKGGSKGYGPGGGPRWAGEAGPKKGERKAAAWWAAPGGKKEKRAREWKREAQVRLGFWGFFFLSPFYLKLFRN